MESIRLQKTLKNICSMKMNETNEQMAIINAYSKEEVLLKIEQKQSKQNYVNNSTSFILFLQYDKKQKNGLYFDEIFLEGINNANLIMDSYRSNGHNLGLKYLQLSVNDENETKIKKVTFKK